MARVKKPDDLPEFGISDSAYRFRRVRYLDEVPVALEEIWLDGSAAEMIALADLSHSLYHYYHHHLGLIITKVEDVLSLAPPPQWYIAQPSDDITQMMGFIERLGWAQDGRKIEYSRTWFAPERARYVSRLR